MTDTWYDLSRTRQGLFRYIGGALSTPSVERCASLAGAFEFLDARGIESFAYAVEWYRHGRHLPVDPVESGLDVDYVRLFASGARGAPCPPIESHYRATRGGPSAEFITDLLREYGAMGLHAPGGESPDHISTEMEVMSVLCGREAAAWEAGDTAEALEWLHKQLRFLKQHLNVWVPLFREMVAGADPSPFYKDLVDLAHAVVAHETHFVPELIGGAAA